jgi:hypothetical protein
MDAGAVMTMAKKQSPKPGRPKAAEGEQRDELIAFRCRSEYKVWALELAGELRLSPTDTLDAGLVELAKKIGFRKAPKR